MLVQYRNAHGYDADDDGPSGGPAASSREMRRFGWEKRVDDDSHGTRPFWKSRSAVALVAFAAISLFLLLSEHRAHVLGALPYLLLLSCPLMHLFMHHGHGHDGRDSTDEHPHSGEGHDQHR